MAVCGRCWICGCKFDCTGEDEGATVVYKWTVENVQRKICTSCVEAIDGDLPTGPNEPHGDGIPATDRLGVLIGLLVNVAAERAERET